MKLGSNEDFSDPVDSRFDLSLEEDPKLIEEARKLLFKKGKIIRAKKGPMAWKPAEHFDTFPQAEGWRQRLKEQSIIWDERDETTGFSERVQKRQLLIAEFETRLAVLEETLAQNASRLRKERLFYPEGISTSEIKQGRAGDCYFLAVLDVFKRHRVGRRILLEAIKTGGEKGPWDTTFIGMAEEARSSQIDEADLKEMRLVNKAIIASLGDCILQRAYARAVRIQNVLDGRAEKEEETVLEGHGTMEYEGGFCDETMQHLAGSEIKTTRHLTTESILKALEQSDPEKVYCMGTISRDDLLKSGYDSVYQRMDDENKKTLQRWANDPRRKENHHPVRYPIILSNGESALMSVSHAYSVRDISRQKREVRLVNPHQTKKSPLVVGFEEFASKTGQLYEGRFTSPKDENRFAILAEWMT